MLLNTMYLCVLLLTQNIRWPFIFTPISDAFLQKIKNIPITFRRVSHSTGVDAFPLGTRIFNSYVNNSIVIEPRHVISDNVAF